ncbi:hypothetical protein [Cytobacillus firmus]|uniref:hypothetical protein n=1 Tax=Cytobacillus firmus TaxID=1399 RepID=UPI001C945A7F|nr:hypothetical protein [Cytobacillus firmus]MBY6053365.1 hypothetical protein [Cytobacillus firmus]
MNLYFKDKLLGVLPESAVPNLFLFCHGLGLQIAVNRTENKVQVNGGLSNKVIGIFNDEYETGNPLRNKACEEVIIEAVRKTLSHSGASTRTITEKTFKNNEDLLLSVHVYQIPRIKQPILEIFHRSAPKEFEWISLMKSEADSAGIKFSLQELNSHEKHQTVRMHIMYPQENGDHFWEVYGYKLAHVICLGLLCRLSRNSLSFAFAAFPFEALLDFITSPEKKPESDPVLEDLQTAPSIDSKELILSASAYFDYHIISKQSNPKNPKIYCSLFIRNTGNTILVNPVVCLRISPKGTVSITGQIVPPKAADTLAIQGSEGSKGWQFMHDNWMEQSEESGEVWIKPIHELSLSPGESTGLTNLQLTVKNNADSQTKVEAFIYFSDSSVQIEADNKISIMYIN